MSKGDATKSDGDTSGSEEVTTRPREIPAASGGKKFWAVLDNFTCKSRTNPAAWDTDDEYPMMMELIRAVKSDPIFGDEVFWSKLALVRLGHDRKSPFFAYMYPRLKKLGRLRGIKKDTIIEELSLPHLERIKSHLNTDELLSMAIHYEAHEWLRDHQHLGEGSTAPQARAHQEEARVGTAPRARARKDEAGGSTDARAQAGQDEAGGSPNLSTASTQSMDEDHTGIASTTAAGARGEGEGAPGRHGSRESGVQGSRAVKRERDPSPEEQQPKKRHLTSRVKEEEGGSEGLVATGQEPRRLFIYDDDDDSDVL